MANFAIEAMDLRRSFRTGSGWRRSKRPEFQAVKGVSFTVEHGELFGLLGPNGAGKSTTIRMLCSLLTPTSGTARVCGYDVVSDTREVRRRIGYVFGGDRGLYDRLSGLDNLRYFAELAGVPAGRQRRRISELLETVGLSGRENDRVSSYSRGMRQRLHIARGLLSSPEVLFLDEPSIGVDPVAARELRDLVAELSRTGTTVLLTTHYMYEAEELCSRIAVIADGRIRALGSPAELKRRAMGRDVLEVEAYGVDQSHVAQVHSITGVYNAALENRGAAQLLTVQSELGSDPQEAVLRALKGVTVRRVDTRSPSLEDAYVAIVSESDGATTGNEGEDAWP
ncbi:ATP-binding cassette domain-containing protein [Streptomyces sp. NPDC001351]|uniref:ABC transporter ATP-binding protein n=1 Tax=Streptomyces sp. NPDC001351 TaxID=3364564 RepID=UPI0036ADDBB1